MAHPNPKHPNQNPSNAQLKTALALIAAEIRREPLRSSTLSKIMRDTFDGSDASGAWNWRMAYDMMQAAAVQVLLGREDGSDPLGTAKPLAMRLLTETRRSEQQIRLQQFSTPLPYAALAVRAAAIRTGETVLEPSAGTGSLAGFAKQAGAKVLLNEVDPFRQRLLDVVFDAQATGHDAEHIDDLLASPSLPSVIVMNPPFASSVDRSRDKHIAAKHLIGAAKRLAPGGRLVAIMPMGFSPECDAAHWARTMGILTPRLGLTMPGHVYRKLGTSVDTQLMVFDKVQDDHEMIRVSVDDLDAAVSVVDCDMAHPLHHAESSARKFGGEPSDYQAIHDWFDASKAHMAFFTHRALRHHTQGIFEAEREFGLTITNSAGRAVPVRWIGEQHVKEDCQGRILSMADWFRRIQPEGWMANGHIDLVQAELARDLRADWIADVTTGKTILGFKAWMDTHTVNC